MAWCRGTIVDSELARLALSAHLLRCAPTGGHHLGIAIPSGVTAFDEAAARRGTGFLWVTDGSFFDADESGGSSHRAVG